MKPLRVVVEAGGEYLLGFAKKKLARLKARMAATGQTLSHKALVVDDWQLLIKSMPGSDLIRISGGVLQAFSAQTGHRLFGDYLFTDRVASKPMHPEPLFRAMLLGAARALNISRPDIAEKLLNAAGMNSDAALFDGVALRVDPQYLPDPSSDLGRANASLIARFAAIVEPFDHSPLPPPLLSLILGANRLHSSYADINSISEIRQGLLLWAGDGISPGFYPVYDAQSATVSRGDYRRGFAGHTYTETPAPLETIVSGDAFSQGGPFGPGDGIQSSNTGSGVSYVESYGAWHQITAFTQEIVMLNGAHNGLPNTVVNALAAVVSLDVPTDFSVATFVRSGALRVSRNFSGAIALTKIDGAAETTTVVSLEEQQFEPPSPLLIHNITNTYGEASFGFGSLSYLNHFRTVVTANAHIPLRVFDTLEVAPPVGLKALTLGCLYFPRDDSFLYATVTVNFQQAQREYLDAPTDINLAALKQQVTVLLRHPLAPMIDGQPQPGRHDDLVAFLIPGDTVIFV